jgi:hypothetical protein
MPNFKNQDLRTALADYAHEAWSGWMRYMFSSERSQTHDNGAVTIAPESCVRWRRQMVTKFSDLPGSEKPSDYAEADKMLAIVEQHFEGLGEQPSSESQADSNPLDGDPSEDRVFLEELADKLEAQGDHSAARDPMTYHPPLKQTVCDHLRAVAIGCDQLRLEKIRLGKLEERVDQHLCKMTEHMLADAEDYGPTAGVAGISELAAAIWLLARRTKSAGTVSAIGSGLGALGAGILGNALKGGIKV